MEGWVLAGVVLGFIMGAIFGIVVTFGYVSYRSYQNFIKFQEEVNKAEYYQQSPPPSGGLSA